MLNKIILFSIRNKLVIALFTFALIAWGVWSANRLPIDAVPDITNNQVQVITFSPRLASQEVEQFVTYPLEQSMMTLPDVVEMRSISRYGLSVVTIVFKESVNIYFARQLIGERLKEAQENIPAGMGTPELAPVSTGLGEIYQYILKVKDGGKEYSTMELRTIQDWIVSRQLYGTPGVAEVNSFGGLLKQYEVALSPDRLKAMGVSIGEVFTALEKNNENTGGAYIDKKPNAYYIRGIGLVTSLEDIGAISVKNNQAGIPVLIKDIAQVKIGSAIRYGALTINGESEAVGGIVMMLKGENSAAVVKSVKERIAVIQQSLPEGVEIEAYSDRTELVDRAIDTVKTNLLEGALIVIFVLIIFLGNIRAGLIVASAIPLSLLFALGMMNVFGVSANLMSLGAVDFGLIIDGSLIIIEATMHHLGLRNKVKRMTQAEMDMEVFTAASKIRTSASFGEIIILIVYIPVLSLTGIEGKMFKPMAQTVSFAIIGALILSMTYIPMMCATFLSKKVTHKVTISDKLMLWLQKKYTPILSFVLARKKTVVIAAFSLLAGTVFLFSRMGGEFLPQLKEGDYAFHCILPQGTSLSQSIETAMQAQRIIKSFPEVRSVVGKTGTAEIPMDPMPPEASDLIISLKPQSEWTTTKDYNRLADSMMQALSVIPGVFFESSQPIQMRFNELMTGVRQDVAIKIFGENIDTLALLAPKVAALIAKVKGVAAPQVEQTQGLPQIAVAYDRARLAGYGLTVADVNRTLSAAFSGETAGVVFENEKKFDLVVRLDSNSRKSVEDVHSLFVSMSTGAQIPLAQIAKITLEEGPAQISREDGRRRTVIGFNIADRDVQTVVNEIQQLLKDEKGLLPAGYYITYGGTFENLQEASDRLAVAVPVALLLIFFLLYMAFNSVKQALLIYTAIPMAAIGGVITLWLKDMPFSISAGVGFIALFGVAVLNGIVLISSFNALEKEGITDVVERVMAGTKERLRPVLMTASVASLGFLPMALSTGAGAEVQRPLAIVVIGGLITATLLTLLVLPCLYILFNKPTGGMKVKPLGVMIAILLISSSSVNAQERITLNGALELALEKHKQLSVADAIIRQRKWEQNTISRMPNTAFFVENEDYTPQDRKGILKIGITQTLQWPGIYKAKKEYAGQLLETEYLNKELIKKDIAKAVTSTYYQLWYLESLQQLYIKLDSQYQAMFSAASLRFQTGDVAGLDSIASEARMKEMRAVKQQNTRAIIQQQQLMKELLMTDTVYLPELRSLDTLGMDTTGRRHPYLLKAQQESVVAATATEVFRQENKPDFSGRFFSQRLYGLSNPFTGFSVSVGFPLFNSKASKAKVNAAIAAKEVAIENYEFAMIQMRTQLLMAMEDVEQAAEMLAYYHETGLVQANAISKAALLSYTAGELSYAEMSQFITQAITIEQNYLKTLNEYNQSMIQYNYYWSK